MSYELLKSVMSVLIEGKCRDLFVFLLIIKVEIDKSGSVYISGYSPLHLCALNGRVEEMECLIMKGAEVNLKVREK